MTKRHQFHEFMPAVGCIAIKNNDGKGYFAQYQNWNQVDVAETVKDGRFEDFEVKAQN